MDEAGIAPTAPTGSSGAVVGQPLLVPYEPSSGRRVNVIGGYVSHGPETGWFEWEAWACLPKSPAKTPRKSVAQRAEGHGLTPDEVGTHDAERVLAFLWRLAGRPSGLTDPEAATWQRERLWVVVLDNYSVHHSQPLKAARPLLEAARVFLFYLPSYSPERSDIEAIWRAVKYHDLPVRSHARLGDLKRSVETALQMRARQLQAAHRNSTHSPQPPT